ncbi:Protein Hook 2 [Liparis tanakae]|uniref:Protein Hook 2 n=1 Tax=Liparis tanakae TaxID=230148 RepID=A0A4Z2FVR2_9TELE|nr:Protein Hook 2 [Liparis tanakae]
MSLDKAEPCDSLLTWIQTFRVPSCTSKQDLTSGVAVGHVLHRIDPSWFNETWLGRIKEESGDNWRLKVSNLKKILKSVLDYYHDVLDHQISDVHMPDVNLIGEMGDVTELGKLVQLVLGCAVSCEKKQEQIRQIMTLEESVQHVVMTAIQELLSKEPSSEPGSPETYGDFDYQSRKYYFLSEEADEKLDLSQRCRDLEHQLSAALEEKSSLQAETRSLKEKLSGCDSLDASTTAITGKKLLLLQSQMEQLQEENYRLDNSRDDMRVRGEILEREVVDLQLRNEELTSLAQEAQALKDEMDILRHSSDRVHELHARHSAEAMKAEKWQFEYKNLHDKFDAVQKEKEHLVSERDTLRETNDELRCAQVQQRCLSGSGESETVVRLQSENKMLCVQEEAYRQKLVEAQTELEEAQRSKNVLETHNRLNEQQISELRSQIEELQKELHEQDSKTEDSSLLKKKLEEHLEKLHEAHSDLQKKKEVLDDLEPKVDGNMVKKIDELQASLRRKDEDMKQMEERYKRYVEKARTVIKTLDPKQQPVPGTPAVQALKNQLTEKQRKIKHLEHDYEKSRARHDQEEKLIISAWYNMGMALQQRVSGERLGPSNQAMSFLAQQRQERERCSAVD